MIQTHFVIERNQLLQVGMNIFFEYKFVNVTDINLK